MPEESMVYEHDSEKEITVSQEGFISSWPESSTNSYLELLENYQNCGIDSKLGIGRTSCRVKRDSTCDILEGREKYGGYRKDVLTEKLTERDEAILIRKNAKE